MQATVLSDLCMLIYNPPNNSSNEVLFYLKFQQWENLNTRTLSNQSNHTQQKMAKSEIILRQFCSYLLWYTPQ